jgi:hypothetical protein
MTNEEIEWFEDNWHKGKSLQKATINSREYKSVRLPWWVEWDRHDGYYFGDRLCWKTNRKTHYKVPKVKKEKKRKPVENPCHSYRWQSVERSKIWESQKEAIKKEKERKEAHIAELKKVGHWYYQWKYTDTFNIYTREWLFCKRDLNNPYDTGKYRSLTIRRTVVQ